MVKAMEYEAGSSEESFGKGEYLSVEKRSGSKFPQWRTEPMRGKEELDDYRYFPEPDVPPILLTEYEGGTLRESLPELPGEKLQALHRRNGDFGSRCPPCSANTEA